VTRANNAAVVSAYGDDLALYASRCRVQLAAAVEAGSERLAAVARMFLVEATLNSGDIAHALELSRASVAEMRCGDWTLARGNSLATFCVACLMANDPEPIPAAALDALRFALPNGVGGWLFDPLSLYAARIGRAEDAAKMLGFADACYAAIEEVRRLQDQWAEGEAVAAIEKAIGVKRLSTLRQAGRELTVEQGEMLARQFLAKANSGCLRTTAGPMA
jgi:hypothetical protein